ncbi:MAG: SPOR domain-containing protein [Calditrichaeota bacterium]|nr:SPOR domain-containing protein [Calditrichota bacterium]
MPEVQKYQQFWIILILLLSYSVVGQDARELAELYAQNRTEELRELRDRQSIRPVDWRNFVESLFISDAEVATQNMLAIYGSTSDNRLRGFIRERISNFYSARGYYETARRIETDNDFMDRLVTLNRARNPRSESPADREDSQPITSQPRSGDGNGEMFAIQAGAFTTLQNARRATQKYRRYYSTTRILEKEKDGQPLYIVVVGEYKSRNQAETALPEINNRLNLKGYVIEY